MSESLTQGEPVVLVWRKEAPLTSVYKHAPFWKVAEVINLGNVMLKPMRFTTGKHMIYYTVNTADGMEKGDCEVTRYKLNPLPEKNDVYPLSVNTPPPNMHVTNCWKLKNKQNLGWVANLECENMALRMFVVPYNADEIYTSD